MPNEILAIAPYWLEEVATWVFNDPQVGLQQEPFVSGVPEIIDFLVKDIPNARSGFRLLFSASPFPGCRKRLTWRREEFGGNWYASDDPPMEGWLCPALFRYFEKAPAELYVKAEAKRGIEEEETATRKVLVTHRPGLHARPCVAIVETVHKFRSRVQLRRGHDVADAHEVLQLLSLGVEAGTEVTLTANGPDADDVLDALVRLFQDNFGFDDGG